MSAGIAPAAEETKAFENRLQLLEDIEDVRQLKSKYAKLFDRTLNSGEGAFPQASLLSHFSADAVWESKLFGTYKGRDQIEKFLRRYRERVSFAIDYCMGHLIEIASNRKSATGFWTTWQPLTLDGAAYLLAGRYNDEYARVGEHKWVFTRVQLDVEFLAPYKQGWSPERVPKDWKW